MAGWLFVDAPLEEGEELLFRRVCTLRRGRRTVGGEVSVTDRRLVFVPNRLEQLVGVKASAFPRASVDHVTVVPPPPGSERFAALPRTPRARAEVEVDGDLLVLQLEDAAALAGVLGH
ncbi:hypothetical protein GCM10022197_21060 [Microlunatus spumicola]|uniref:EVE domain-containing protein n=1 Tax=Microlunatus spumicola TaxID=81499 RepID=A0ABP6XF56_9ACTN